LSSKYNKLPREENVYRDHFKLIQMDNLKGYVNLLFKKNVFKTKHVHLLERFPK